MPVSTNQATHSNYLSVLNVHPKDADIEFDEGPHIYTIKGQQGYTSVTTWNHLHFEHFDADAIIQKMMTSRNWTQSKYYGMTAEEIKETWRLSGVDASESGTKMHYDIECFYNNRAYHENADDPQKAAEEHPLPDNDSIEFTYFKQFLADFPDLKPYRTEWMIYDEDLKFAGSIHMLFGNPDGSLEIYDWKRSKAISREAFGNKCAKTACIKHLPDSNYWHYSLQLNTYKALIQKNYGKKVGGLYLVRIHPNSSTYERIEVADLQKEIADLFEYRAYMLANQDVYPGGLPATTSETPEPEPTQKPEPTPEPTPKEDNLAKSQWMLRFKKNK